jgi:hypothetical protein
LHPRFLQILVASATALFQQVCLANEVSFDLNYGYSNSDTISGNTVQSEIVASTPIYKDNFFVMSGFAGILLEELYAELNSNESTLLYGDTLAMTFGLSVKSRLNEKTELYSETGVGAGLTTLSMQQMSGSDFKSQEIDGNSSFLIRTSVGLRFAFEDAVFLRPFIRAGFRRIAVQSTDEKPVGESFDGTSLNLALSDDNQGGLIDDIDSIEIWQTAVGVGIGFEF